MTRAMLALGGLLFAAQTVPTATTSMTGPQQAQQPAPAQQDTVSDTAVTPTDTGVDTTVGQDPATLPDTTTPADLPPSGAIGIARTSPAQSRVVPPAAGEPIAAPQPTGVNLTPTTAEEIANAQLMLQGMGLYKGPINGLLTGPTRAALRVFQAQARLPVTGHLDVRTSDRIGLAQEDGALEDTTVTDQIEQLQTEAGLPVTGEVDAATLQVLREGLIPQESGLPSVRFRDTLPMVLGAP